MLEVTIHIFCQKLKFLFFFFLFFFEGLFFLQLF